MAVLFATIRSPMLVFRAVMVPANWCRHAFKCDLLFENAKVGGKGLGVGLGRILVRGCVLERRARRRRLRAITSAIWR